MRGSLQSYGIDAIHVPDRLRPLREDRIAMLVDSIAELGLQTPITVCIHERVNIPGEGEVWEVPVLVAGRHRLEATRRLGLTDIACMVVQADADHCRLWEIDENLARAELTATEEAEHLHERKRVWERIRGVETGGAGCASSLTDGRASGPQHQKQFAADTAASTGRSKATINRAVARAEAVCDDARALLVGTDLDTGAYLDRLMKADPAEQVERVQRDLAAIERRRHDEALRREEAERLREAKEAREAAKRRVMDRLLNKLSPRDWDLTIADIEAAGGSLKASDMRSWMAPQTEAA
jgi:hypothetical protein